MKKILLSVILITFASIYFGGYDYHNENDYDTDYYEYNNENDYYTDYYGYNNEDDELYDKYYSDNSPNNYEINKESGSSAIFGIGITSPLLGEEDNIYINNRKYTRQISGINILLGFTNRKYIGKRLPENGGSFYVEYGTFGFILPYVGLGMDLRLESAIIGIGFPDIFHINMSF